MTVCKERRCAVLVALQEALLGEVTPRMRAIIVQYDDTHVEVRAYFEGEIGDDDREALARVETELIATFPEGQQISCEAIRSDPPALIPKDRTWVYHRMEPLQP